MYFYVVGRSTTCTIVPADHFGAIPGVPVGTSWKYRIQVIMLLMLNFTENFIIA